MAGIQTIYEQKDSPWASLLGGVGQGFAERLPETIDQQMIERAGGDLSKLNPRLQKLATDQQIRQESLINARETKENLANERNLAREAKFSDLAKESLPDLSEEEFNDFMDLSNNRYGDVKDVNKRYRVTKKVFDEHSKSLNSFSDAIAKKNRTFLGLSDSGASSLSDLGSKMIGEGIDIDRLERIVEASNLSQIDKEKVLSKKFSESEKLIKKIPFATTLGGGTEKVVRQSILNALSSGVSINLLVSELSTKGFSQKQIEKYIREGAEETTLTKRQSRQLINPRRASDTPTSSSGVLDSIFGR